MSLSAPARCFCCFGKDIAVKRKLRSAYILLISYKSCFAVASNTLDTKDLRVGFSAKSPNGTEPARIHADMPYIILFWRYITCHRFSNLQASI